MTTATPSLKRRRAFCVPRAWDSVILHRSSCLLGLPATTIWRVSASRGSSPRLVRPGRGSYAERVIPAVRRGLPHRISGTSPRPADPVVTLWRVRCADGAAGGRPRARVPRTHPLFSRARAAVLWGPSGGRAGGSRGCDRPASLRAEAFPLHARDEEESIAPRLRSRDAGLDAELETLAREHVERRGPLADLVLTAEVVGRDPGRRREVAPAIASARDFGAPLRRPFAARGRPHLPGVRRLIDRLWVPELVGEFRARRGVVDSATQLEAPWRRQDTDRIGRSAPGPLERRRFEPEQGRRVDKPMTPCVIVPF